MKDRGQRHPSVNHIICLRRFIACQEFRSRMFAEALLRFIWLSNCYFLSSVWHQWYRQGRPPAHQEWLQNYDKVPFDCLMGWYREDGYRFFLEVHSERSWGNGYKLEQGKFQLDVRNNFFTMRVIKHLNKLLSEFVESLSMETLTVSFIWSWTILSPF